MLFLFICDVIYFCEFFFISSFEISSVGGMCSKSLPSVRSSELCCCIVILFTSRFVERYIMFLSFGLAGFSNEMVTVKVNR